MLTFTFFLWRRHGNPSSVLCRRVCSAVSPARPRVPDTVTKGGGGGGGGGGGAEGYAWRRTIGRRREALSAGGRRPYYVT